jgi:hypothetical protein
MSSWPTPPQMSLPSQRQKRSVRRKPRKLQHLMRMRRRLRPMAAHRPQRMAQILRRRHTVTKRMLLQTPMLRQNPASD